MENIEDIYELSPMQQGMLFHTLYAPESGVYFEQLSCTLQGDLNIWAFKRAWQEVATRHSVLRTSFYWEELDKPLQVVNEQVELPWFEHNWCSLNSTEQQERLKAFLEKDIEQGFELHQAPLMRCALIKVRGDTYQFVWSFHHLLMDGWSFPIILKEVFAFYEAFHKGQQIYLSPARPYRDYITWLQQQDRSQAERFWQQALQGFSAPTPLVVDRALAHNSHPQQTHNLQERVLSAPATAALQSFARQHHLTLNTLVQGAWALLLSRYSGESDVVFGATVSGRPTALSGVESMVGLFINTLPVRVQVCEQMELLPWLMQLQAQQVEREQYSYSSLLEIQHNSELPQGMPLFESIVVFENYPVDASLQAPNNTLNISNVRSPQQPNNYPLTLIAAPGSELLLEISYDTRRFEATTIERMLMHVQTLLEGIVTNPQQCISDVPLLTATERHQLLVEWNHTHTEEPEFQCLHQLFEAQVEQTPEAVAVVFEDQQLTYRELNARANQLAHHLQAMGVEPEVLVAICVERSLEMVVGVLGILKAGGAYVPLDPAYPFERLSFILGDAQPPVLLTQERLVEELPSHWAQVVCLDSDWEAISQGSKESLSTEVTAQNLAYVIYTSGSTGKPKGVLVTHQNLLHSTNARISYYSETLTSFLLLSSFAFDSSVAGIFWTLCQGGILVLPQHNFQQDPQQLIKLIAQNHVSHLLSLPSLYALVLEQAQQQLVWLRTVIVAGESCLREMIELHIERLGHTSLFNEYGPTEATVWSSVYKCRSEEQTTQIPIGCPITNTQIYILDRHLQPVPIGVAGELHIAGAGLTRGYLNSPELTLEKFIPNPFSKVPGACLYKTGDLARYLPNANIEFLGRLDRQVKIRGFRIELGEIEAVLSQHPEVQETALVAREDQPGNKRLVAYVVLKNFNQEPNNLQSFLKKLLPEYMVPSAFVMLEALPLTPSGKVDYRVLPAPDTSQRSLEASLVPPRTPTEEVLAAIWADVLGVAVGIHDNFFELGGHSLVATQITSRLRQAFQVEVPLRALFERRTVANLAELVVTKQCEQAESDALAQILGEVDELSDDEVTELLLAEER